MNWVLRNRLTKEEYLHRVRKPKDTDVSKQQIRGKPETLGMLEWVEVTT